MKLNASDKRWSVFLSIFSLFVTHRLTCPFFFRWDYSELVNTRNARYRTFMMLLMGFFGVLLSLIVIKPRVYIHR